MKTDQNLDKLVEGNNRFINKELKARNTAPSSLANGQSPHTIVITCADSRVPPELIFDQDLGDLFVIRIAGNTASDEAVGSAEYAAANLGSSTCIVLGHTNCGAVAAAIDHVKTKQPLPTPALQKVVDPIIGSVEKSIAKNDDILDNAIDFNVQSTMTDILEKSSLMKDLCNSGKLNLVGAKYHLESGKVQFMD